LTAYAIDDSWIGVQADHILSQHLNQAVIVMNDADAAGIAEMRFGVGKDIKDVVILLTIGTGLGSALFYDGRLIPNFEIGWMEIGNKHTGSYFAGSAMERDNLNWEQWGARFHIVLSVLDKMFRPRLFILGGGFSEFIESFSPYIKISAEVKPAKLRNHAGIIGAAIAASEKLGIVKDM
ncbi:MAG: ROK family protein, partial [Anaerolineales bacterium]